MSHTIRWTIEKITQRLALIEPLAYRQRMPLPPFRYQTLPDPVVSPPVAPDVDDSHWPIIQPDSHWGTPATDFVLRSHFTVPPDWPQSQPIALYLPLGDAHNFSHPEALAYIDGVPYAACDRHHQEIRLPVMWCDGRPHMLALHGWTGLGAGWNTDPVSHLVMHSCAVVQIDQPTRDFIATARVALGAAKTLDPNTPARNALLNALDQSFVLLDTVEPFGDRFYASIAPAHAALNAGIAQAGPPMPVILTATGHAHIDVAWLWTLDQTRRKAGRSFHTVLRLMEQFPDYHFTQSQPQLYEYIRSDYPDLFDAIKQRVAEGRWEPIGGMWVEADCNLTGAESLARQFLLGRTYFRQHFGADAESPVLWLPDVFGYAWALPQLIKQAGLDYFFTIKIGWSQYNRMPYDSFWWQGLDGTQVLTHFSTSPAGGSAYASTYNAMATPAEALGAWNNFQQKEMQNDVFMAFGYGDGGGGPTREMLENLRELAEFPAMPAARQRPVGEFFRDMEREAGQRLPIWNGELYLEYHRGTYTTQSRNKRANRKCEFLLHDTEFVATLAARFDASYVYPKDALLAAWRLMCLNQFHDIIPGSSIGQVYVDSQAQYAAIQQLATEARDSALAVIGARTGGDLLLVNPTGFARRDLALWSDVLPATGRLAHIDGHPVRTQTTDRGTLIDAGELSPYSVTPLVIAPFDEDAGEAKSLNATPTLLENRFLRVEFDANGDVTRIYDKTNERDVLAPGALANQLQAFEDRPKAWDAWDIDIFYDDRVWLAEPAESVRVVEAGPLRATLEIKRRILNSTLVQHVSLAHNSPRLDFDTTIDWRERHILLKVAFPVDVLAPTATHEIQWGNVERPTHRNTSWDWARFETCAHKWVDLSEGDYGVSLLNDCKYGYDVRGNVIRLSLLRSPTIPDGEADQGEHHFVYSLLPHAGGWEAGVIPEAYCLNDPILVSRIEASDRTDAGSPLKLLPLVSCDSPNIVLETIKQAENGRGVIVRLYESQRRRGWATLTASFPLKAVEHTNLLEEHQADLTPVGNQVTLFVKPYEIVTLRLIPA
ncbi:MAG: alpha-mannosidase [Caldilineae bacterium]|nr:alpha-mannosidase [Caldilineae bacterium]